MLDNGICNIAGNIVVVGIANIAVAIEDCSLNYQPENRQNRKHANGDYCDKAFLCFSFVHAVFLACLNSITLCFLCKFIYNADMQDLRPLNKAGFTLVEVLVLVFVISLLSITALTNFLNSNLTLDFLANFKEFRTQIRAPRSYAINNQTLNESIPPGYGVYISEPDTEGEQEVIVFADNGELQGFYDDENADFPDTIMTDGEIKIDNARYSVSALASSGELTLPLTLIYENGSAMMDTYENGGVFVPKDTDKFVALKFQSERDISLYKYLVIFQVAGLAEEANKLPNETE